MQEFHLSLVIWTLRFSLHWVVLNCLWWDKGTWRDVCDLKGAFHWKPIGGIPSLGWLWGEFSTMAGSLRWFGPFEQLLDGWNSSRWILSLFRLVCSPSFRNEYCIMYWKAKCCLRWGIEEFITRLLKTSGQILMYFGPFPKLENKLNLGVAMQTAAFCSFIWKHHLGTLIVCPNYCKDFSVLPNSYNFFFLPLIN